MGGGPSSEQRRAAEANANLTNQLGAIAGRSQDFLEAQQAKVNPFYESRMKAGLPYFPALTDYSKGTTAQAFQPARAALGRRLASMGALPSGFRMQANTDLDAAQARSFDSQLINNLFMNEQAKQAGASGLLGQAQIANPLGYYGTALQGNQSIMQAPLAKPGLGGLLGGLAGGALAAF